MKTRDRIQKLFQHIFSFLKGKTFFFHGNVWHDLILNQVLFLIKEILYFCIILFLICLNL